MGPSTILIRLVLEVSMRAILTLPVKARGPFHRRWAKLCNVVMLERAFDRSGGVKDILAVVGLQSPMVYIVDIAW
jgi:hypothetical protein